MVCSKHGEQSRVKLCSVQEASQSRGQTAGKTLSCNRARTVQEPKDDTLEYLLALRNPQKWPDSWQTPLSEFPGLTPKEYSRGEAGISRPCATARWDLTSRVLPYWHIKVYLDGALRYLRRPHVVDPPVPQWWAPHSELQLSHMIAQPSHMEPRPWPQKDRRWEPKMRRAAAESTLDLNSLRPTLDPVTTASTIQPTRFFSWERSAHVVEDHATVCYETPFRIRPARAPRDFPPP